MERELKTAQRGLKAVLFKGPLPRYNLSDAPYHNTTINRRQTITPDYDRADIAISIAPLVTKGGLLDFFESD